MDGGAPCNPGGAGSGLLDETGSRRIYRRSRCGLSSVVERWVVVGMSRVRVRCRPNPMFRNDPGWPRQARPARMPLPRGLLPRSLCRFGGSFPRCGRREARHAPGRADGRLRAWQGCIRGCAAARARGTRTLGAKARRCRAAELIPAGAAARAFRRRGPAPRIGPGGGTSAMPPEPHHGAGPAAYRGLPMMRIRGRDLRGGIHTLLVSSIHAPPRCRLAADTGMLLPTKGIM